CRRVLVAVQALAPRECVDPPAAPRPSRAKPRRRGSPPPPPTVRTLASLERAAPVLVPVRTLASLERAAPKCPATRFSSSSSGSPCASAVALAGLGITNHVAKIHVGRVRGELDVQRRQRLGLVEARHPKLGHLEEREEGDDEVEARRHGLEEL